MFPALRIGYMVVPHELLTPLLRLKHLTDMHCPILPQITLARFISERHLEHHIARMKRIYSKRRKCLIAGLSNVFGSRVKIAGMPQACIWLRNWPEACATPKSPLNSRNFELKSIRRKGTPSLKEGTKIDLLWDLAMWKK